MKKIVKKGSCASYCWKFSYLWGPVNSWSNCLNSLTLLNLLYPPSILLSLGPQSDKHSCSTFQLPILRRKPPSSNLLCWLSKKNLLYFTHNLPASNIRSCSAFKHLLSFCFQRVLMSLYRPSPLDF